MRNASFPVVFLSVLFLFSAVVQAAPKKSLIAFPADPREVSTIRVLVQGPAEAIDMETAGPYRATDAQGRALFAGPKLIKTTARPAAKGIELGTQKFFSGYLRLVAESGVIRVGDEEYRDSIELVRDAAGKILAINELPLEDYLKGVLPHEVSPNWPLETLKAQAVAARTYAAFNVLEHAAMPYDVSSGVHSQVYRGAKEEHNRATEAIEATRGQFLIFNNGIFPAFFHSTCGGATTAVHRVWERERIAPLEGGRCLFCLGSKHYRWKKHFTIAEIEKKLKDQGIPVSGVREIRMTDLDRSGRPRWFIVRGNTERKIQSSQFRMAMGNFEFKSTLVETISADSSGFIFTGKGWGHGVGLCQYGSKRLGDLGYHYRQILLFYYPNSKIFQVAY
jgi:stage II sporulation protein D